MELCQSWWYFPNSLATWNLKWWTDFNCSFCAFPNSKRDKLFTIGSKCEFYLIFISKFKNCHYSSYVPKFKFVAWPKYINLFNYSWGILLITEDTFFTLLDVSRVHFDLLDPLTAYMMYLSKVTWSSFLRRESEFVWLCLMCYSCHSVLSAFTAHVSIRCFNQKCKVIRVGYQYYKPSHNPACGVSSGHVPKERSALRDLRTEHIAFMRQVLNVSSVKYLPLRRKLLTNASSFQGTSFCIANQRSTATIGF